MTPTPSLDSLASTYLDGSISPEHLLLLEQMLLSDPDARRQFQRIANLDFALREWAPICAAQSAWADAAPNAQPKRGRWQIWSAAAALVLTGLLTGFISGSLVSARVLSAKEHKGVLLPLGNANFQDIVPPPPDGYPKSYGKWSGDFTTVTGPENGIQPVEGSRMLRFLRADNRFTPQGSGAVSGEVWQLVNLHPIRPSFGGKPARVELSAHFTSGDASDSQKFAFGICAYAFQGDPRDSEALWKNRRDVFLSYTDVDELCNNEPGIWQKMTTQLLVPPDADFLMVQVRVCPRPMPKNLKSAFEFPGQYVSNVSLRLLSDPPIQ